MPVHIDRLVSDVSAEGEPAPASSGQEQAEWERDAMLRDLARSMIRDKLRTAAEGFDD